MSAHETVRVFTIGPHWTWLVNLARATCDNGWVVSIWLLRDMQHRAQLWR
jgi:hypothetical protein